jgi:hypothetical protein
MKVTCQKCGKEFDTKPVHVRNGAGKYCSRTCTDEARKKPGTYITVACLGCGVEMTRKACMTGPKSYCSTGCRNRGVAKASRPDPIVGEEVVLIPLTQGQWAKVDRKDYDEIPLLRDGTCLATRSRTTKSFYAAVSEPRILVHRLIMDAKPGDLVDHRNHDTLDNRRENLRICTNAENLANCQKRRRHSETTPTTSQYKGVTTLSPVRHVLKFQNRYVATFRTPEEAAREYDRLARATYGEFAHVNFPDAS